MDGKINIKKAAITLGIVFAAWHLGWALAIAILGEGFVNWVMDLHFLSMPLPPPQALNIITLVVGAIAAFICGAITGAIFAYVWNALK